VSQNPTLVWLNHSALADNDVLAGMAGITAQVHEDFGPIWHTGCQEVFGGTPAAGEWVIEILDTSDVKGALGYHELENGEPWMKVFQATCNQYDVSWTSCASHEVLEGLADPYVDRAIQTGRSTFTALEVCDPCEVIGYAKDGIDVSDFVTPRWFDGLAPFDRFNWLGTITKPLQLLSGGYIGQWRPSTGWTTRNAEGAVVRDHRRPREVFGLEGDE
jgi:hypothetical protein